MSVDNLSILLVLAGGGVATIVAYFIQNPTKQLHDQELRIVALEAKIEQLLPAKYAPLADQLISLQKSAIDNQQVSPTENKPVTHN